LLADVPAQTGLAIQNVFAELDQHNYIRPITLGSAPFCTEDITPLCSLEVFSVCAGGEESVTMSQYDARD
jgi:hypothetical protein